MGGTIAYLFFLISIQCALKPSQLTGEEHIAAAFLKFPISISCAKFVEFGCPAYRCVKGVLCVCVCCQSDFISSGNVSCFSVRVHVGLLLSTVRGLEEIELECICRRY